MSKILKTIACLLIVLNFCLTANAYIKVNIPEGDCGFSYPIVLPNGNYVIVAPCVYSSENVAMVGAVFLYNGKTHQRISSLYGTTKGDRIGSGGVFILSNSNFVVSSPEWHNGPMKNAGAVTLVNGITGLNDQVSVANSLVGTDSFDVVGTDIIPLTNGNYVVYSPHWNKGSVQQVGAVTWGDGNLGVVGPVDTNNSLIGSSMGDFVVQVSSNKYVFALSNGNYIVTNPQWDKGNLLDVGAVTWGNGNGGTHGIIGPNNSLVGNSPFDSVGNKVFILNNGNYVVGSRSYDHGVNSNAGAVTWGNGTIGTAGVVSELNSLVGSSMNDYMEWVTPLSNGNFIVSCPLWDSGNINDVGLVKWVNGQFGDAGVLNANGSWIGSKDNDQVGNKIVALNNGNAIIMSEFYDNSQVVNVGAATWINGSASSSGVVSVSNSMLGNQSNDFMRSNITSLSNGHYVLSLRMFDVGNIIDAGAVMWCDGNIPTVGLIDTSNCLHGSATSNQVGIYTYPLVNGHYVVVSLFWDYNSITDAGAVTWCNGNGGTVGRVDSTNSLIGSSDNDYYGDRFLALSNGNYVVGSWQWDNGVQEDAGAVTWCNGNGGTVGSVNESNSLVGAYYKSNVCSSIRELTDGNYVVISSLYRDIVSFGGAITWCKGSEGRAGYINASNSIVGQLNETIGQEYFLTYGQGEYAFNNPLNVSALSSIAWAKAKGATVGNLNKCNSMYGEGYFVGPIYNPVYNYLMTKFEPSPTGPPQSYIIIIYPSGPESINEISACRGYWFNGQWLTNDGVYLDTLLNSIGCDSIYAINLKISTPGFLDTNVSVLGRILVSQATDADYQWITCNPYRVLKGENKSYYKPDTIGEYAVIVSRNGCSDTSNCHHINYVQSDKSDDLFYVYPNPSSNSVYVQHDNGFNNAKIRLLHINGQVVRSFKGIEGWRFPIDISTLSKGVYFVQCNDGSGVYLRKVIKE